MRTRKTASRAGLVLVLITLFFLTGCGVLEDLLGEESSSGEAGRDQQPKQQPPKQQPQRVLAGYNATLEITDFTCFNAEEDDYAWSTGQDEITFIYTILQTDPNGWVVRYASYGWGPYDIYRGDRYNTQYFQSITLPQVPVGHGLIVTLTIIEIEDYSKAQKIIKTINDYAFYVELANTFNPEPYSKTAIEITAEALYYAEIALDFIAWADDDDLLADQVDVGTPDLVYSTLAGGGYLHNGWNFSGVNNTDHYEYEVSYVVHLQPLYR